ncbi:MAG TPA: hypothetical protein VF598_02500, partial [Hymenobacter sp.]
MHKHYLLGTLLFLLSTLAPHRGQAQEYDPLRSYQILHYNSNLSLQINGNPPHPRDREPSFEGREALLDTYTGGFAQVWTIVDLGQGLYGLKNRLSQLFLMPGGSGTQVYWAQSFAPVQAAFNPNEDGQKWIIRNNTFSANASIVTITNFKTGLSLSRQASTFNTSPDPNAPIPIKLGQNVDFGDSFTGWQIIDRTTLPTRGRTFSPDPPVAINETANPSSFSSGPPVTIDETANPSADKERQSTVAVYPN